MQQFFENLVFFSQKKLWSRDTYFYFWFSYIFCSKVIAIWRLCGLQKVLKFEMVKKYKTAPLSSHPSLHKKYTFLKSTQI